MSDSCIFCKIAAKEIPASIIWEDERYLAFLDIKPTTRGHTLIIPKQHYRTFLDVPETELHTYSLAIQRVGKILKEALQFDGFNLFQNNEEVAGQIVFHVHFHLVPRYSATDIQYQRPQVSYTEGEVESIIQSCKDISTKLGY
jgi:histidine triad (HIT) family protein